MILLASAPAAERLAYYDLEGSSGGFVDTYDAGSVDQWTWGETDRGPGGGMDGLRVWSTGLVANYRNESENCLVVPIPALGLATAPMFTFHQWYSIAPGDAGRVYVDAGVGWVEATPAYGYPSAAGWTGLAPAWELLGVDLAPYGPNPSVCLGFQADDDGEADLGWFIDNVGVYDGDALPPNVASVSTLGDTDDVVGPYAVSVVAVDNVAVDAVQLHWETDGTGGAVDLVAAGDTWNGSIPVVRPDTTVDWWIVASDGENEAREPLAGSWSFRVYLPAPRDLDGPDGRVVALTAPLTWLAPEGRNAVRGYVLYRNGTAVSEVTALAADAPLSGGIDTFEVRARYDAGLGDACAPVVVDGVLPALGALSPAEGYAGDRLRLSLSGENLLYTQGATSVDLGEGIAVDAVDVRDVDRAWVEVAIAEGAATGARTLRVETPAGSFAAEDAFLVLDAAERPRLVAVEPTSLRQGERGEIRVTFTGTLAGPPDVDAGEGVVVESVAVEADTLRVVLAVENGAPVGDHALTVDDGTRFYAGVSLEVKDVALRTSSCAAAPGTPAVGVLAGLLLLWARRPTGRVRGTARPTAR